MKKCKRCNLPKSENDFYQWGSKKNNICKSCFKESAKLWSASHKEERKSIQQRWNQKHQRSYMKEYIRKNRKKISERLVKWRLANPEKAKAHWTVRNAIQTERLSKPNACELCGTTKEKLDGHHPDYSKPLEVVWLCPKCHRTADRNKSDAWAKLGANQNGNTH